jgi:hypothetical protein
MSLSMSSRRKMMRRKWFSLRILTWLKNKGRPDRRIKQPEPCNK